MATQDEIRKQQEEFDAEWKKSNLDDLDTEAIADASKETLDDFNADYRLAGEGAPKMSFTEAWNETEKPKDSFSMDQGDASIQMTENDAMPFNAAFAKHRGAGEKEFEWRGKRYTTELASDKPATGRKKDAATAASPVAQGASWYETATGQKLPNATQPISNPALSDLKKSYANAEAEKAARKIIPMAAPGKAVEAVEKSGNKEALKVVNDARATAEQSGRIAPTIDHNAPIVPQHDRVDWTLPDNATDGDIRQWIADRTAYYKVYGKADDEMAKRLALKSANEFISRDWSSMLSDQALGMTYTGAGIARGALNVIQQGAPATAFDLATSPVRLSDWAYKAVTGDELGWGRAIDNSTVGKLVEDNRAKNMKNDIFGAGEVGALMDKYVMPSLSGARSSQARAQDIQMGDDVHGAAQTAQFLAEHPSYIVDMVSKSSPYMFGSMLAARAVSASGAELASAGKIASEQIAPQVRDSIERAVAKAGKEAEKTFEGGSRSQFAKHIEDAKTLARTQATQNAAITMEGVREAAIKAARDASVQRATKAAMLSEPIMAGLGTNADLFKQAMESGKIAVAKTPEMDALEQKAFDGDMEAQRQLQSMIDDRIKSAAARYASQGGIQSGLLTGAGTLVANKLVGNINENIANIVQSSGGALVRAVEGGAANAFKAALREGTQETLQSPADFVPGQSTGVDQNQDIGKSVVTNLVAGATTGAGVGMLENHANGGNTHNDRMAREIDSALGRNFNPVDQNGIATAFSGNAAPPAGGAKQNGAVPSMNTEAQDYKAAADRAFGKPSPSELQPSSAAPSGPLARAVASGNPVVPTRQHAPTDAPFFGEGALDVATAGKQADAGLQSSGDQGTPSYSAFDGSTQAAIDALEQRLVWAEPSQQPAIEARIKQLKQLLSNAQESAAINPQPNAGIDASAPSVSGSSAPFQDKPELSPTPPTAASQEMQDSSTLDHAIDTEHMTDDELLNALNEVTPASQSADQKAGYDDALHTALAPEQKSAIDLINSIDNGGVPLNTVMINNVARNLGLDVSGKARPEETISRIREAVSRINGVNPVSAQAKESPQESTLEKSSKSAPEAGNDNALKQDTQVRNGDIQDGNAPFAFWSDAEGRIASDGLKETHHVVEIANQGFVVRPLSAADMAGKAAKSAPEAGNDNALKQDTQVRKGDIQDGNAPFAFWSDAEGRIASDGLKETHHVVEIANQGFVVRPLSAADMAGKRAATSPDNEIPGPSDAQKAAGNYQKGHVKVHGLDIAIENPQGSVRSGTDANGAQWSTPMRSGHYGYIKGTTGKDKDHIDVLLTPGHEDAKIAWVIDQKNKDGTFDEHKTVIGPDTEEAARSAYNANYEDGWDGIGAITSMPMEAFKAWATDGKQKRKALSYQEPAKAADASKPVKQEKTQSGNKTAREMNFDGSPTDGKPINPGDVFLTSSGNTTTPFPKQKKEKYASQWTIDNAVAEAKARGDTWNEAIFSDTKPLKNGELTPADRDSMLEYLFGNQPDVVPSIFKPLVSDAKAETQEEAKAEETPETKAETTEDIAPPSPSPEYPGAIEPSGNTVQALSGLSVSGGHESNTVIDNSTTIRNQTEDKPSDIVANSNNDKSYLDLMDSTLRGGAPLNVLGNDQSPSQNTVSKFGDKIADAVLQNRDRSTQASIAQMTSIAAKPDYGRLGFSRDFANGAPVVAGGSIPEAQLGRDEVAVTAEGKRIPVQYAVVEASDLLTSHDASGIPDARYNDSDIRATRAIAGNGRIAGLKRAYENGNATQYTDEMKDDILHGVSHDVIAGMEHPILVRVMPESEVTDNIGDVSNTTGNLGLSPVEKAKNDIRRINLDSLDFNEDGTVTQDSVRRFVQSMPLSEQNDLLEKGRPNRQAIDRVNAAIFTKAYGNDELSSLYAAAQDPEAKNILSALAIVAPKMARLEGLGSLDIRKLVADAAEIAVNARRNGVSIAKIAQQADMAADPDVGVVLDLFAKNARSIKPIVQALSDAADFAYTEAARPEEDMFGATPPKATRQDLINRLRKENERGSPQAMENPAGGQPSTSDAVVEKAGRDQPGGTGDTGQAEGNRSTEESGDGFGLTGQTEAEIRADEARDSEAKKQEDRAVKAAEDKRNADAEVSGFTLTGSDRPADSNPNQSDMFGNSPNPQAQDPFANNKIFTADKVDAARARLKDKLRRLNSGIDPELLVDGMTIAGGYIESGVRKYADYAKEMIKDFGAGIRPFLRSFYEAVRNYPGLDKTGMSDPSEVDRFENDYLPEGWSESTQGGLATNNHPMTGGIVDKNVYDGEWFFVSNNDNIKSEDGFKNRFDALNALHNAMLKAGVDIEYQGIEEDNKDNRQEPENGNTLQPENIPDGSETGDQEPISAGSGHREQVDAGLAGERQESNQDRGISGRTEVPGGTGAEDLQSDGSPASGETRDSGTVRTGSVASGSVGGLRGTSGGTRQHGQGDSGLEGQDHVIDTDDIGKGGLGKKYRDNIDAIRLLKAIETEGRKATAEERKTLARYVGWGALKAPFDSENKSWSKQHAELKALLTDKEFEAARASTLDAHYTSPVAVGAIYDALSRIGVKSGRILEPSVGVGNFFGMMPSEMRTASQLHGVELDSLTSRIVSQLYPKAKIAKATGFQDFEIPSEYFDVVVGNPPFGSHPLTDSARSPYSGFSIHNYFLAKSIDKLRPGGVMAIVVSHNFLDAMDGRVRKWIGDRASLVGGVRLPNTAFKENAGTEVVTDILIFQKYDKNGLPVSYKFQEVGEQVNINPKTGEHAKHAVNQFFTSHPQFVLGKPSAGGSMYAANEYTVEQDGDIKELLSDWVKTLPENLFENINRDADSAVVDMAIPDGIKVGSYYVAENGTVMRRGEDVMGQRTANAWEPKNNTAIDRMKGMIAIRDAMRTQMRLERSVDATSDEIELNRAVLNSVYDAFVSKYKHLNSSTNRSLFIDDTEAHLIQGLEFDYDRGVGKAAAENDGTEPREASAKKADIFKARVAFPPQDHINVTTAKDALLSSLNFRGRIDGDYMSDSYGKPIDEIIGELGDLVFHDPLSGLVTADEYLSGDVKTKLDEAKSAAQSDSKYKRNVAALEKVIPKDKSPSEIWVNLGASFIPGEIYEQFIKHISGGTGKAKFEKGTGQWLIAFDVGTDPSLNTGRFGTADLSAQKLFELTVSGRGAVVKKIERHADGSTTTIVLEKETEAAREKQNAIKSEWQKWLWQDPDRSEFIVSAYNEKMNRIVARKFDGSHMDFPGMNPSFTLLEHQKNAVWRGVQDRQMLLDQTVGAGKTFEMAALAMEMRRLGISRKPLFAVPNHLTQQWRSDFLRLYPGANILVAGPEDFAKGNRERLFAKIVTGDWDSVIVGHSSIKKFGISPEFEAKVLKEQIDELVSAIEHMKRERGDKRIIADMERIRKRREEKYKERLNAIGKRSQMVTFDELGVDGMFIDEMHEFKNLAYDSMMDRVPGMGNPNGSSKAFDLFLKSRWLFETFGERVPFITATGTPVSNSLVEMYNMQRYMQYQKLKDNGLHLFDPWALQFGNVESVYEVAPSGSGYRQSNRFSKFTNLPALMGLYNSFADTITLDDLKAQEEAQGKKFPVPKIVGGRPTLVVAKRSDAVANLMGIPSLQFDGMDVAFKVNIDDEISVTHDGKGKKWVAKVGDKNLGEFETEQEARLKVVEKALSPVVKVDDMSILGRFARLKYLTKETKGKINALSLTGEANKAGLDYRLIDPNAPDFAGSKINLAVDNMVRIYAQWSDDRGTQLVFCDMSIPLSARSAYSDKARRVYVRDDSGELSTKRGTLHSVNGFEEIPFFVVQRGAKDEKRFDVYDAPSGIKVSSDYRSKHEAVVAVTDSINDTAYRQKWMNAREIAGEISQGEIDEFNNDNDIEQSEMSSFFTLDDIAGISGSSKFSVYDDIKSKLIARGVPEREIAFIHDYHTPKAKEKLFREVNDGDVRFLLGSTPKMGAGTNVQTRLVGLHHIDAPWRPSDLEQREGRIIRRGNELYNRDPEGFEVFIGRYATEQTYDTRRWQILEHKARGIEQLRNYDGSTNEIEDIDGEAANAADMKAAASGDPLILEETKLRNDVRRLEQLQAGHADEVLNMTRKARNAIEYAERIGPSDVERIESLISISNQHPEVKDVFTGISLEGGKKISDKDNAHKELTSLFNRVRVHMIDSAKMNYRGLDFSLEFAASSVVLRTPTGRAGTWGPTEPFSPGGLMQRLKNYIDRLPSMLDEINLSIRKAESDAESMSELAKLPFQYAADLDAARVEYRKVQIALMAKGPAVPEEQKPLLANAIDKQKIKLRDLGFDDAVNEFDSTLFSRGNDGVSNPHTEETLRAEIDRVHGKGFAGLLEGTGNFSIINADRVDSIIGSHSGNVAALAQAELDMVSARIPWFGQLRMEEGNVLVKGRIGADEVVQPGRVGTLDGKAADEGSYLQLPSQQGDTGKTPVRVIDGGASGVRQGARDQQNHGGERARDGRDISRQEQYGSGERTLSDQELAHYLSGVGEGISGLRGHGVGVNTIKRALVTKAAIESEEIMPPGKLLYSDNGRVLAFVKYGKVFMVADNISRTDDSVDGLLKHEIGVHALTLGKDSAEFQSILNDLNGLRGKDARVDEAFNRVPTDTPSSLVVEEAMGYLVEGNPDMPLVKRFVSWLRDQVRALAGKLKGADRLRFFKWAGSLNADDMIYMAGKALRNAPQTLGKSEGRGEFMGERNRWVSPLAKGIQLSNRDKMPAKQWGLWIAANKSKLGLKDDEIQWSGITDYLDLRGKDSVTKQEISDYLSGHGVRVDDVVKGNIQSIVKKREAAADAFAGALVEYAGFSEQDARIEVSRQRDDYYGPVKKWADPRILAAAQALKDIDTTLGNNSKFESYWGNSYKGGIPGTYSEILVSLPSKQEREYAWEVFDAEIQKSLMFKTEKEARDYANGYNKFVHKVEVATKNPEFRSPHWNEPNVLVHLRVDEINGADGKRYLRVGEIQSDWGQKGREEGFLSESIKVTGLPPGYLVKSDGERYWVVDPNGVQITAKGYNESGAVAEAVNALNDLARGTTASPIPDAPFVTDTKSWVALGIKRAIIHAIDVGADGVVFGTGEQNANLYDLSKQVDDVYIGKRKDGQYEISVHGNGDVLLEEFGVPLSRVEDIVGKDLAKKAEQQQADGEFTKYEGQDLKVGGEGMKAFYDKIVPQVANDVLKKLGGGKVEGVDVGHVERRFSGESEIPEGRPIGVVRSKMGWSLELENTDMKWGAWSSKEDAERGLELFQGIYSEQKVVQPGFTITDTMRGKVRQQGMPLFSKQSPTDAMLRDMLKTYAGVNGAPTEDEIAEAIRQYREVERMHAKELEAFDRDPKENPLKAPNGKPSNLNRHQWVQVRTPNFKRWFGDWENDPANASKVVSPNGEPLVVYHGTDNVGFTSFDTQTGAWFSDRFDVAASYAGRYNETEVDGETISADDGQGVYEVYLRVENPLVVDFEGNLFADGPEGLRTDDFVNRAKRDGRDGVLIKNVRDVGEYAPGLVEDDGAGRVFVAIDPTQIKSAIGNTGTFSPDSADIRFSQAYDPEIKSEIVDFWNDFQSAIKGRDRRAVAEWIGKALSGRSRGLRRGRILGGKIGSGTEVLGVEGRAAGFDGYRSIGVNLKTKDGKDALAVYVVPNELSKGLLNNKTVGELRDTAIVRWTMVNLGNGRFEASVVGPMEGGTAFRAMDGTEYLDDTHRDSEDGFHYYRAKIGYSLSAALMSEAFRRLAMNTGEVPSEIHVTRRDTGSRAGLDVPRSYPSSELTTRFSKKSPPTGGVSASMPPEETLFQRAQRVEQDQMNRFNVVQQWVEDAYKDVIQYGNRDVYRAEERMHGKVAAQIDDFRSKTLKPLIDEIHKSGFKLEDVEEFLHAQHAAERNAQIAKINTSAVDLNGIPNGSGMTDNEASAILASHTDPAFRALANRVRQITESTKNILLGSGIISRDQANAWDATYQHYVPLRGYDENDQASRATGKGSSVNARAEHRRATGHQTRDEHIIENIIYMHERAMFLAAKNEVGKHMLRLAASVNNSNLWTVNKPEKRAVVVTGGTTYSVYDKGIAVADFKTRQEAKTFIDGMSGSGRSRSNYAVMARKADDFVSYMASGQLADNEAVVYVNGDRVRIQLNDPLLARAYKKMGAENLSWIMGMGRDINRFLSRAYTGLNPEFIVTNATRDLTTGLINTTGEHGVKVAALALKNWIPSMREMFKYSLTGQESAFVRNYRMDGGGTGAAYLSDIERIGKDTSTAYKEAIGAIRAFNEYGLRAGAGVIAKKALHHTTAWIEHLNAAAENGMRLAVYKAMIQSGKSRNEAASAAKNMTVNFNRRGEIGDYLGSMYLFANPSIQGRASMLHALFKGKHKYQAWAALGGLSAAAILAAMAIPDDDWEEIPQFEKDSNLLLPTPFGTLKVSVPYGHGVAFMLGNALYDMAKGKHAADEVGYHMASGLLEHLYFVNPLGDKPDPKHVLSQVIPFEPLRILARSATNKTGFGNQIMPENKFDEHEPDFLKMYANTHGSIYEQITTTAAKATGGTATQAGGVDISPETLKFLFESATGGTGRFFLDSVSLANKAAHGVAEGNLQKIIEVGNVPMLRKFVRDPNRDPLNAKSLFWERWAKAKEGVENFKRADKAFDEKGLEKLSAVDYELLADDLEYFRETAAEFRDNLNEIRMDDSIPKGLKQIRLRALEREYKLGYREMRKAIEDGMKAQ